MDEQGRKLLHTPGPWIKETYHGDWNFPVEHGIVNRQPVTSDEDFIAQVHSRGGRSSMTRNPPNDAKLAEAEANAMLIAATPDLLDVALAVAEEFEDAADWKDAKGRLQRAAWAALEKAGIRNTTQDVIIGR